MSTDIMERLSEASRVHVTASMNAATKRTQLETAEQDAADAHEEQFKAGEKRTDVYREAFANGLVITRILIPELIEYHAGEKTIYDRAGVFEAEDPEQVWLELDETHDESLQDVYATRARVGLNKDAQLGLRLDLEIPGVHGNTEVDDEIHRPDWFGDSTDYRGALSAVEWRLPTETEMQSALGALATSR